MSELPALLLLPLPGEGGREGEKVGCLLPSRVWAVPPLGGGGGNGRAHRWLSTAAAAGTSSTRPSVFSSSAAAVAGCGRDGRAEECRRFFWLLKMLRLHAHI